MKIANPKEFIFKKLPETPTYKKTSLEFRRKSFLIKEHKRTGEIDLDSQLANGGLKDAITRLYRIWKNRAD